MADTVRLMHTHMRGDRKFYFYEGETDVEGGVISLPTNRPEWIRRAWVMGWRLNPETGATVSVADALAGNIEAAKTAEDSSKEQDENSDSGRQSGPDNGVREGEQPSVEDSTGEEPSGRVRRRSRESRRSEGNVTGDN